MTAVAVSVAAGCAWLAIAARVALAHGDAPAPDSVLGVLSTWSFEPYVWLPIIFAWWLYRLGWQAVARAHPANPMPRWRAWCWNLGLAVLLLALASPIAVYDTTLFADHMVQHLLLTLVAAPLLALGAPITLLLRVSSPAARRRWVLPVLHSRVVRVVSFPVVAWVLFAGVMFGTHFSALYEGALHDELLHIVEHGLYLGAALLFWWPVVGADPSPWRLPHPARILYLFLAMPWNSFLGLAIFSAPAVMYPHYATLVRDWGPTPLEDQQWGGGIMWVGGDLVFLVALILAVWVWLRAEEAEGRRVDAQLDRAAALAARRAATPVDRPT
jgi:putative membrane protein